MRVEPINCLMIYLASKRLQGLLPQLKDYSDSSYIMTEKTVPGIGKNLLRMKSFFDAVKTYDMWSVYCSLDYLFSVFQTDDDSKEATKEEDFKRFEAKLQQIITLVKTSEETNTKFLEEIEDAINREAMKTGFQIGPIDSNKESDTSNLWENVQFTILSKVIIDASKKDVSPKDAARILLDKYENHCSTIVSTVIKTKKKDDIRGAKLMGDAYKQVHIPTEEDDIITKVTELMAHKVNTTTADFNSLLFDV